MLLMQGFNGFLFRLRTTLHLPHRFERSKRNAETAFLQESPFLSSSAYSAVNPYRLTLRHRFVRSICSALAAALMEPSC